MDPVANIVTTRTNATSRSVGAINSNAKKLNARKTKLLPKPRRMETREVKVEAKGLARMEPPSITPGGARWRQLLLLLLPRVTLRNSHRETTPPQRSQTPRRGDWPGWPNRSWLRGPTCNSLMENRGAALKMRTWFFGIPVKIGDQVFQALLDTGATISIVARAPATNFQDNQDCGHKSRGWANHPFPGGCRCVDSSWRRICDAALHSAGH